MTEKNNEQSAIETPPDADHPDSATAADASVLPRHTDDGLNTDGRAKNEWQSKYPEEAWKGIRFEGYYIAAVLFLGLICLLLIWNGTLVAFFNMVCLGEGNQASFKKFSLFFLGGLLGGSLFGIKYFYKVVGRGYWNEDRQPWRLFSPFISGGLALAVGAMVDSGLLGLTIKTKSASSYFAMGFLTGYFADSALAKMQEVADTVFGSGGRESAQSPKPADQNPPSSKS